MEAQYGSASLVAPVLVVATPERKCLKVPPQNQKGEKDVRKLVRQLWFDESGQDLTEYALLLVLLTLAAVTSSSTLGQAVSSVIGNVAAALKGAGQ
jgi:Flp pilus assembly pilin Flp